MKNNTKYHCDICGRPLKKKNRAYGYTLCMKHMHQYLKYHKFLDNNPRTQKDLNEFREFDTETIEFDCYDKHQNIVGHFYIDKDDLQLIKYHKWRIDTNNRVITGNCTSKNPRRELSHFILNVTDDALVVDHRDGNSFNNKKDNLRICTQQENLQNKHFMSNNTSGTIGVMWDKHRRRWAPEIQWKNQKVHLGRYKNIEEAKYTRYIAEQICFKEFQTNKNQTFPSISNSRKNELETYVRNKLITRFGNKLY